MTHHPSYTPTSDLDESDVLADARDQRDQYEAKRADELFEQAMQTIRQLAQLVSSEPSAMLDVIDELRSLVENEIDSDLVEVAPGVTLPSADAARYLERKRAQDECPRCQFEHESSFLDADEYDAVEPAILNTRHTCHVELYEYVAARDELTLQYVRGLLTLDEYKSMRVALVDARFDASEIDSPCGVAQSDDEVDESELRAYEDAMQCVETLYVRGEIDKTQWLALRDEIGKCAGIPGAIAASVQIEIARQAAMRARLHELVGQRVCVTLSDTTKTGTLFSFVDDVLMIVGRKTTPLALRFVTAVRVVK